MESEPWRNPSPFAWPGGCGQGEHVEKPLPFAWAGGTGKLCGQGEHVEKPLTLWVHGSLMGGDTCVCLHAANMETPHLYRRGRRFCVRFRTDR